MQQNSNDVATPVSIGKRNQRTSVLQRDYTSTTMVHKFGMRKITNAARFAAHVRLQEAQGDEMKLYSAASTIQRAWIRRTMVKEGTAQMVGSGAMTEAIIARGTQRRHIRSRMQLILIYAIFLALFTYHTIAAANDDDHFNFMNQVEMGLTEEPFAPSNVKANKHIELLYKDISNITHFNQWLRGPFIQTLALLDPKVAPLGGIRIGQLRLEPRSCMESAKEWNWFKEDSLTKGREMVCQGGNKGHFYEKNEATNSFGSRAHPFEWNGWNTTDTEQERSLTYSTDQSFSNYYITFPSPAYGVVLPPTDTNRTLALVDFLINNQYVDMQTTVVVIDMSFANFMLERLVYFRFTVEFTSAGGAIPFLKVLSGSPKVLPTAPTDVLLTVSIFCFFVYFAYDACKDIKELGWEITKKRTTLLHHLNVLLYFVNLAVLLAAMVKAPRDIDWASSDFVNVKPFLEFVRVANMLNACNAFLSWFKMVNFLSLVPQFAIITGTLSRAAGAISAFLVIFLMIAFAFGKYFDDSIANFDDSIAPNDVCICIW
jgi:hypothetical protein